LSELKTPRSSIRELAMAMLQIEQMVESRYLNPPLGTSLQKFSFCYILTSLFRGCKALPLIGIGIGTSFFNVVIFTIFANKFSVCELC